MSRIRSIHPGLWTDEAFVALSAFARLLFMGIWNECDDMGAFEWSPLKLKMRVLPADNVDANDLLAELLNAETIMQYEHGGKRYGAVRNFCQYQRPKKPNSTYPQTEEVRAWVNINARSTRDGSELVGNQLPTDGEKSRRMEDGGGNKETPSGKPEGGKARKRAAPTQNSFELPDWVPTEPWQAFVDMRREMERGPKKIPFTVGAAKGIVAELEKFRDAGHDIAAVLMKSAINSYRGVFAPDVPANGHHAKPATEEDRARVVAFEDLQARRKRGEISFAELCREQAKLVSEATGPPRELAARQAHPAPH